MIENLTEGKIPKQLLMITIPASIGFFFNTMFNVVDTYFAGKLGDSALAGLAAAFPAFFIILAASTGIATATTTLVANYLGKGDEVSAKEYYVQGIYMGALSGIILTIIGLIWAEPLLQILNLPVDTMIFALDYLNVIFLGTTFFILASVLNSYLNAIGNTKIFRNLLIVACFLNIIFDPWFMYGGFGVPAMGIRGLALATVLIQVLESLYLFYYLRSKKLFTGEFKKFALRLEVIKQIFIQALPSSFNMMNIAIGSFIINYFVAIYGRDAIAGYGAAIRIEQIALIPTIGLNIAVLTLTGQNNGAKKFDRIREVVRVALKYGLYATAFSFVVTVIFGKRLMGLFTESSEIANFGMSYLYTAILIFMAYVISFVASSVLQGIKYPNRALTTSILRQVILPIIIFPIVVYKFNLGINSVWWSLLIINWIGAILSLIIASRSINERENDEKTV